MTVTTTIEHVVDIDAAPDTVYRMWTTADGLCAWWGNEADADPRPGGVIRVDIDGENVMVGEYVELEPPHRLVFTFGWQNGELGPGSTKVGVLIEARGTGSRLTLRHDGLPVRFVASHVEGWTHFLGERLRDAPA